MMRLSSFVKNAFFVSMLGCLNVFAENPYFIFFKYHESIEHGVPTLFASAGNSEQQEEFYISGGDYLALAEIDGHDVRYTNDGRIFLLAKDRGLKEIIFSKGHYSLIEAVNVVDDMLSFGSRGFDIVKKDDEKIRHYREIPKDQRKTPYEYRVDVVHGCGAVRYWYSFDKSEEAYFKEVYIDKVGSFRLHGRDSAEGVICLPSGRIILKLAWLIDDAGVHREIENTRWTRGVAVIDPE